MSRLVSAGSGAVGGAALGSFLPVLGSTTGAVLGGLGGFLFGGGDDKDDLTDAAIADKKNNATRLTGMADDFTKRGRSLFDSAEQYLAPLVSGDRTAMSEALAPQIRTVTDQYDSAYKAIAGNAPRGGGRNSALSSLRTREAGDLSTLRSTAREGAVKTSVELGEFLSQLGVNYESLASGDLSQVISSLFKKSEASAAEASALGESLGKLLAAKILAGGKE